MCGTRYIFISKIFLSAFFSAKAHQPHITVNGFSKRTAAAKSLQSCPTLCDPIDVSPPDSPAPGILQARTLEWVAISFSNAWKWKVKVKSLSHIRLLATPWIAAYQAPPSMGFSRQEYWSVVPLPSPQDRLDFKKEMVWWEQRVGADSGRYVCNCSPMSTLQALPRQY